MTPKVLRWRSLEHAGLEHAQVDVWPHLIHVRSVLIGTHDGHDVGVRYEMTLDLDWTFRTIVIERTDGAVLVLFSDGKGNWTDGELDPIPSLDGCIDIDLSGTPLTNALPLKRNQLIKDQPQRFEMAWIPLDTLEPRKDGQIYTWLGDHRVRYRAADDSFEAMITVDDEMFVLNYEGLFERMG